MKVLLTGGSGLLGQHLKIEADRPTHEELGITSNFEIKPYDLIIHAAAYTQVEKAEQEREKCFEVNVQGTINLINVYKDTPFVYISSEYAGTVVNYYSLTKRVAEDQVLWHHPNHLIIRTLFKPKPWKYQEAFVDQFTQGDYVDVIAPLIEKEIENWDRKSKLIYVGTGRKTIYELAKQTRPDVKQISIEDIKTVRLPHDYQ